MLSWFVKINMRRRGEHLLLISWNNVLCSLQTGFLESYVSHRIVPQTQVSYLVIHTKSLDHHTRTQVVPTKLVLPILTVKLHAVPLATPRLLLLQKSSKLMNDGPETTRPRLRKTILRIAHRPLDCFVTRNKQDGAVSGSTPKHTSCSTNPPDGQENTPDPGTPHLNTLTRRRPIERRL